MNSLQIEQPSTATNRPSLNLKAQRNDMRKAFAAWLKRPTDAECQQSLHLLMVDYELGVRMRALFPLAIPTI